MGRRKLESGLCGDASEVIREALRLLAARDELERLRAALIAGERSGLVEDFSMDELIAELDEEAHRPVLGSGFAPPAGAGMMP